MAAVTRPAAMRRRAIGSGEFRKRLRKSTGWDCGVGVRLGLRVRGGVGVWRGSAAERGQSCRLLFHFLDLGIAETIDGVVVDHAGRLHKGVADGGADEFEVAFEEGFAHGV